MNINTVDLPRIAIEPMTKVIKKEGYFSDPYPIHFAPKIQDSVPLTFSGTTQNLLICSGALRPECFQQTTVEVNYDAGYAPDDHPRKDNGNFKGNHRRPYYTAIKVAVPDNIKVDAASNAELAEWITLVTE